MVGTEGQGRHRGTDTAAPGPEQGPGPRPQGKRWGLPFPGGKSFGELTPTGAEVFTSGINLSAVAAKFPATLRDTQGRPGSPDAQEILNFPRNFQETAL